MITVLLLHGFNGPPPLFKWIKEEVEKLGYHLIMPILPIQDNVRYDAWKKEFESIRKDLGDELIVIAHSIGNSFIIKYQNEFNFDIILYIALAGFSDIFVTEGRDNLNKAVKDMIPSKEEINNFKNSIKNKHCIYSIDDHLIPLEILKKHVENIKGQEHILQGVGHMGNRSKLDKLPEIMKIIEEKKFI